MPTKTELIWDGKYDENGNRVAPLRVALPFQTVETVNESAQDRQLNLFQAASKAKPWRNRLIWGDKKYVLPSLLPEFAGKVDLIYIDPPFDTGADFSFTAEIAEAVEGEEEDQTRFIKQPSIIEQKAYRDIWGRGLDSYLQWFYETALILYELMSASGTLYVQLDWHVGHRAKLILDEIFGPEQFGNEIIWKRAVSKALMSKQLANNHDIVLTYQKTRNATWNEDAVFLAYDPENLDQKTIEKYTHRDSDGRLFQLDNLINPNPDRPNLKYEFLGVTKVWRWTKKRMQAAYEAGLVVQPRPGGVPRFKRYLDEQRGRPLDDVWTDIPPVNSQAKERLGYPTQKPEQLLQRIIQLSSNADDLILDAFVGSGTTAAVAEKLNRRWIACDLGRFAIHTTRKRLLCIPDVRPFVVQNLGKYERQAWQVGEFGQGEDAAAQAVKRQRAYVAFILELYHATPVHGYTWLHGLKKGRMVHVGSVDAPVSAGDVTQIAAEFKRAVGTGKDAPTTNGVDVLGWDFAFEINEVARQQAAAANIPMQFKRIPRDVMDKRAVEQGDIHFFELAALGVDVKTK